MALCLSCFNSCSCLYRACSRLLFLALPGRNLVVRFSWLRSLFLAAALYRYAVFGSVSLFFFLIFFLNFWVASRFLGATAPGKDRERGLAQIISASAQCISDRLDVGLYTSFVILSVVIALPLYQRWEDFPALHFFSRCQRGGPGIRERPRLLSFRLSRYTRSFSAACSCLSAFCWPRSAPVPDRKAISCKAGKTAPGRGAGFT